MQHPAINEYKAFAQKYIDLVPNGDYPVLLQQNTSDTISFFNNIPEEKHSYAYAQGKWTVKDVLLHIIDTERVMTYRTLTGIRGDKNALHSDMNQDTYASGANTTIRTLPDLLEEFQAVRTASQKLFDNIDNTIGSREVHLADGGMFTVRALGYIIIGHAAHHQNILSERYL